MGILLWIIFGAIVGWIASMIMNTNAEQGALINIVVGVIGAILGGWIMGLFGYGGVGAFDLYGFIVAILGACVLIFIVKAIRGA